MRYSFGFFLFIDLRNEEIMLNLNPRELCENYFLPNSPSSIFRMSCGNRATSDKKCIYDVVPQLSVRRPIMCPRRMQSQL